jgi:hypothetical protein
VGGKAGGRHSRLIAQHHLSRWPPPEGSPPPLDPARHLAEQRLSRLTATLVLLRGHVGHLLRAASLVQAVENALAGRVLRTTLLSASGAEFPQDRG